MPPIVGHRSWFVFVVLGLQLCSQVVECLELLSDVLPQLYRIVLDFLLLQPLALVLPEVLSRQEPSSWARGVLFMLSPHLA